MFDWNRMELSRKIFQLCDITELQWRSFIIHLRLLKYYIHFFFFATMSIAWCRRWYIAIPDMLFVGLALSLLWIFCIWTFGFLFIFPQCFLFIFPQWWDVWTLWIFWANCLPICVRNWFSLISFGPKWLWIWFINRCFATDLCSI